MGNEKFLAIPCAGGRLVATQVGEPGRYDEVEVGFVRDSDGLYVQCAVVGTNTCTDGSLHVYCDYDSGGPRQAHIVDKETDVAWPAPQLPADRHVHVVEYYDASDVETVSEELGVEIPDELVDKVLGEAQESYQEWLDCEPSTRSEFLRDAVKAVLEAHGAEKR